MSVDLEKMTVRELRAHARDKYGLNLPVGASEQMIRDAIEEVKEQEVAKCPKGYYRIVVAKSPVKGGDRDVPVTVGEKRYLLKRGVEINAPEEVVEVLRNAIETRAEPRTDENGRTELVMYEVPSYPFSILGQG